MPTADKNKAALQGLIDKANAATGGADATVTDAVDTLIAGFGQGGGSGVEVISCAYTLLRVFKYADFSDTLNVSISLKKAPVGCGEAFQETTGVETITLKSPEGSAPAGAMFLTSSARVIDLTDFSIKYTGCSNMFAQCGNLTEIKGELDLSACTSVTNMFRDAGRTEISLQEVRFKAGTINIATNMYLHQANKLSDASIQSIIDGLADLTGGTAQTLTLHADVGAKLTDEQKAAASAKNWTLAY